MYNCEYVLSGTKPHTKKLTFYLCYGDEIRASTTDINTHINENKE